MRYGRDQEVPLWDDDPMWDDEASSYDEASRARYRRRASRRGGSGPGGFDNGIKYMFIWALALFAVVSAKLVWLQVIKSAEYTEMGVASRTTTSVLRAKRGTIYDRNGNVLAISVDCKTVFCYPEMVNDAVSTADLLVEYLGGDPNEYLSLLRSGEGYTYIERQVDESKAERLAQALEERGLEGVYFEDDIKRDYPYGDVGGQIIGFVNVDGSVKTGLESYYDAVLSGEDGEMVMELGNGGTPIAGATNVVRPARDGADLILSIDIDLQRVAEEQITKAVVDFQAESGSVMVTDPTTGEILAACSTPLLPVTRYWEMEEGADTLKLVTSSYEPGSIFKVITSSIGINAGLVTPWSTYTVPPEVLVGDDYVSDDDGRDWTMTMTLAEMLRRSSNTGLAMVAQESIGAEAFAAGVSAFGIGTPTGIDYPGEVSGIVRSLDEYDGSTLGSMAFGQGLAIPLVQMVKAVGTVANGGVPHTPHFLVSQSGEPAQWPAGEQVVSPETCSQVVDMMREVVLSGTGVNAQVSGYDVAGKTGTGEQADAEGGYREYSYVSSFIGFAPASEPKVLAYVGLNGTPYLAYGSAAPTFSTIMGEALLDMGVQPSW